MAGEVIGGEGIVLVTSLSGEMCDRATAGLVGQNVALAHDLSSLAAARGSTLLAFGTSLIVPPNILKRFRGGSFNIHTGSPDYPGRDPHHWAVYEGALRYGATLHVMTERVDEGPILDIEWFDVRPEDTPGTLLSRSVEAGFRLIVKHAALLRGNEPARPMAGAKWGSRKRTRADFDAMCRIESGITRTEFERILRAFDGEGFDNLTVRIHGYTFRIEKPNAADTSDRQAGGRRDPWPSGNRQRGRYEPPRSA